MSDFEATSILPLESDYESDENAQVRIYVYHSLRSEHIWPEKPHLVSTLNKSWQKMVDLNGKNLFTNFRNWPTWNQYKFQCALFLVKIFILGPHLSFLFTKIVVSELFVRELVTFRRRSSAACCRCPAVCCRRSVIYCRRRVICCRWDTAI